MRSQLAPDTKKSQRNSIRLKDYDYSQEGAYFVTICTKSHKCLFGKIVDGGMQLSEFGDVVDKCWLEIPHHFPNVEIDAFVVMPNHIHGIVSIVDNRRGEVTSPTQKGAETAPLRKYTLGQITAYFKYQTTRCVNQIRHTSGTHLWQRNYYEHVVHSGNDLNDIRQYVLDNPVKWDMDENNPDRQIDRISLRGEPICLTR